MFLNHHHHPTGPAAFLVATICIITFSTNFPRCLLWIPSIDEITFLYLLHHLKHICKKTQQDPPLMPRFLFHPTRPPDLSQYRRGRAW